MGAGGVQEVDPDRGDREATGRTLSFTLRHKAVEGFEAEHPMKLHHGRDCGI